MPTWLIPVISSIVTSIIESASPLLKNDLDAFANSFYVKAKATTNPWDDILASLIMIIAGIKTPEK